MFSEMIFDRENAMKVIFYFDIPSTGQIQSLQSLQMLLEKYKGYAIKK